MEVLNMKIKPTLYVVIKYDVNGNEIEKNVFPIHSTSLYVLDSKYDPLEYDIYYGRYNKKGNVIVLDKLDY